MIIMDLKEIALKHKIEYIACLPIDNQEGFSSVVVALVPYYCGEYDSYLSKYTRGLDYHKIGRIIMDEILKEAGEYDYKILIDASPLDELSLAYKAGLGKKGLNGLIINEKYGSYVFVATALLKTDKVFSYPEQGECLKCGKCISACPGKAIKINEIDYKKCLSHITQSSKITDSEEEMIKKYGSAWGCDMCQDCCPLNRNTAHTPFSEFREHLLLEINDINSLSQKEFKKKYKNYALAYKGRNILRRNINLIKNT